MSLVFGHLLRLASVDPVETFCLSEFVYFCSSDGGEDFLQCIAVEVSGGPHTESRLRTFIVS